MLPRAWTLVLLPLLLAGCAQEPLAPAATAAPPPPPEGKAFVERVFEEDGYVDVHEVSGTVTGAAWMMHVPEDAPVGFALPIHHGASSVRIVVTWEGRADFDAALRAPHACEASSLAPSDGGGLDCVLLRALTKTSADGWFHAEDDEPAQSVLELEAATIEAWNVCKAPPCRWHALAFYNTAAQTPFTLRAEVAYAS